jgi:AcrR family transcriptional regulator
MTTARSLVAREIGSREQLLCLDPANFGNHTHTGRMPQSFETRVSTTDLRSGSNGLPRGHVSEIQRNRMLAAAIDAVAEVGYARMTVAQVIARARVSRKTFYDVFEDREDCFLAVFEQTVGRAAEAMEAAYASGGDWRRGVRAGLSRLMEMMDEEPVLARLCVVEALGAGERVLTRRAEVLAAAEAVVDRGRERSGRNPGALTAQGVVGAVFTVLHARLLEPDSAPLGELLGSLMEMIVLPYLGARAADSELTRRARPGVHHPPPPGSRPSRRADPLQGVNMRLTYRTVRVLTVISEHPHASNREIAARSGIADQGQISKLLTRLAKLGLIANFGEGQERGAANAWELTQRGAQIERAARPR